MLITYKILIFEGFVMHKRRSEQSIVILNKSLLSGRRPRDLLTKAVTFVNASGPIRGLATYG
jgi:hypothetical protein